MITLLGCDSKSPESTEAKIEMEEIVDTEKIVIGFDTNSYVVIMEEKDKIKELEGLFNHSELTETKETIQQPYLTISFKREQDSTLLYIDKNDTIKLNDGRNVKSKQINFRQLYSIYKANVK